MTDTNSAPAPAPAPILYHEGQPITAEAAAATRASLLGNADYVKEALAGDVTKQKHLAALWQLERGIQPPPPETIEQAEQQIGDRAERDRVMHTAALFGATPDLIPEQVHQITNGRPIPAAEKQIAQRRLAALQRDKGFVDRYLAGDQEARLQMSLAAIAARGLPVARSLDEIKAWEAAHPFSK
jgi:hypothetical protein